LRKNRPFFVAAFDRNWSFPQIIVHNAKLKIINDTE
jgi:hypothetical protein